MQNKLNEIKSILKERFDYDSIKWTGDNLKEVLELTGRARGFDDWFDSFEDYEKYLKDHDNIFKIFYSDGSHERVKVGGWIVKYGTLNICFNNDLAFYNRHKHLLEIK